MVLITNKYFSFTWFKSPKIKSTIVVFPEPEGPIIKFNEFFISKDKSSIAF